MDNAVAAAVNNVLVNRPTYRGHPLSYWYWEYADKVRANGEQPRSITEWVVDPAHSPQFRAAFGIPTSELVEGDE